MKVFIKFSHIFKSADALRLKLSSPKVLRPGTKIFAKGVKTVTEQDDCLTRFCIRKNIRKKLHNLFS